MAEQTPRGIGLITVGIIGWLAYVVGTHRDPKPPAPAPPKSAIVITESAVPSYGMIGEGLLDLAVKKAGTSWPEVQVWTAKVRRIMNGFGNDSEAPIKLQLAPPPEPPAPVKVIPPPAPKPIHRAEPEPEMPEDAATPRDMPPVIEDRETRIEPDDIPWVMPEPTPDPISTPAIQVVEKPEPSGKERYYAAYREADHTGKPLVVIVGEEYCGACHKAKDAIKRLVDEKKLDVSWAYVTRSDDVEFARQIMRTRLWDEVPQMYCYHDLQQRIATPKIGFSRDSDITDLVANSKPAPPIYVPSYQPNQQFYYWSN